MSGGSIPKEKSICLLDDRIGYRSRRHGRFELPKIPIGSLIRLSVDLKYVLTLARLLSAGQTTLDDQHESEIIDKDTQSKTREDFRLIRKHLQIK